MSWICFILTILLGVCSICIFDLSDKCLFNISFDKHLSNEEYYKKKVKYKTYEWIGGISMLISLSSFVVWFLNNV